MNEIQLLNDQPICEGEMKDGLGFVAYAKALANAAKFTQGPFTIGVFGEWGSGKTSLLRLVKKELDEDDEVATVWFNAWRFESDDQPIVPLVATIIREIERNRSFKSRVGDGVNSILRSLRAVAYGFSAKTSIKLPGFSEIEAGFVAKEIVQRNDELNSDPLLDRSLHYDAFESLTECARKMPKNARVVVVIDDLDRCMPDKALRLLESIKLVLAQKGFIFVIGVARTVLEKYLTHRYETEFGIKDNSGEAYLDKNNSTFIPHSTSPFSHERIMDDNHRKSTSRTSERI